MCKFEHYAEFIDNLIYNYTLIFVAIGQYVPC